MALRYWVGGTAAWDSTASSKWALTSNGTGGQAVPTSSDDVIFDANSGVSTVTITGTRVCKTLDASTFAGTFTTSGVPVLQVSGDVTLGASMTVSQSILWRIQASGTITTNGKSIGSVSVNAASGVVGLGDTFTGPSSTYYFEVLAGEFKTNDFNMTLARIISSGSTTRAITLGSSTVTLQSDAGAATALSLIGTGLTINANTSTIKFTATSATLTAPDATFSTIEFAQGSSSSTTFNINGQHTIDTLIANAPTAAPFGRIVFANNCTITTMNVAGNQSGNNMHRAQLRSSTRGTSRTLTVNTWTSATDVDFRDIEIAGGVGTLSGTRLGDHGNNLNITFRAAQNCYAKGSGSTMSFSANIWGATSNHSSPSWDYFPLGQDTAIFDNSTLQTSGLITLDSYAVKTFDLSNRSNALSIQQDGALTVYGDLSIGSGVTFTATTAIFVNGYGGTQTITGSTGSIAGYLYINNPTGTVYLVGNVRANRLWQAGGTLDGGTANVTVTGDYTDNSSSTARTLNLGSGTWTFTGTGTPWNPAATLASSLTLNANTSTIVIANNTTTARTFAGAGKTYNKVIIGGNTATSTCTITGTNVFGELSSTKTVAHTIVFPNVTTNIGKWSIRGSAGNLVTLSRTGASGSFTVNYTGSGKVDSDYLSISNSTATPGNTWYAGVNSANNGSVTGWIFTAAPVSDTGKFFFLFF